MSAVAKYTVLITALVGVVAIIAGVITAFVKPEIFSGFSSAVSNMLGYCSGAISNVKGAINYFLGGGAGAIAFNVVLWLNIVFTVATFGLRLTLTIVRFINQ